MVVESIGTGNSRYVPRNGLHGVGLLVKNKERISMVRKRKNIKPSRIDSLVGQWTVLEGDVKFKGGLHVDGTIHGNVTSDGESASVLTLSEYGAIEGDVRVPNVILNGSVHGDVHAIGQVELGSNAKVTGNVYYSLIEMAMGAEVNGNLLHAETESQQSKLERPINPDEVEKISND